MEEAHVFTHAVKKSLVSTDNLYFNFLTLSLLQQSSIHAAQLRTRTLYERTSLAQVFRQVDGSG